MFKPSRRAVVIAASFALGLSFVGPYAQAGLLDGGDSVEGLPLPGGELLGGLLEGDLLGGLLGGGLPLAVLGGDLPLDGVLGGELGAGLPVEDILGGGLLAGEGLLAAEGVTELVPDLGIMPGLGSINGILESFSDSGSIVPGLRVLDQFGVLGILGSL